MFVYLARLTSILLTVTNCVTTLRTEEDLLSFETLQVLRSSFDDGHDRANLRVNPRRVDERESGGHARAGTRRGVVRTCVGMRMELTPAICDHGLEIRGVKDDVDAAIGSMRAAGIAAESAEARVRGASTRV